MMYGLPRYLMTKKDFDNAQAAAAKGLVAPGEVIARYQALIDNQSGYVFDRALGDTETADGPEPDYRVVEEDDDGTIIRRQFKLTADSNCGMVRLGYTQDDVLAKISELEAM